MTKIEKFTKSLKCKATLIESSKGYGDDWVRRELYVDDKYTPTYKFAEKVVFHSSTNKNYAVCIGLNPADAGEELDESNKRLIKKIKECYGGYYLFNLFPQIAGKPSDLDMSDIKNKTFVTKLIKILTQKPYKKNDIILFFGRTQDIPADFFNFLKRHKNRRIYLTCYNGEFTHPGKMNSNIEFEKFSEEFLRISRFIRINSKQRI